MVAVIPAKVTTIHESRDGRSFLERGGIDHMCSLPPGGRYRQLGIVPNQRDALSRPNERRSFQLVHFRIDVGHFEPSFQRAEMSFTLSMASGGTLIQHSRYAPRSS